MKVFSVFLFFLFFSFQAMAAGRVLEVREKHTLLDKNFYKSVIDLTIEHKGPAPIWLEKFYCLNGEKISFAEGKKLENEFFIKSFTLNGKPIQPIFSYQQTYNYSKFKCNEGTKEPQVLKINFENPLKFYSSGIYHFSIEIFRTANFAPIEDLEGFGEEFGNWVQESYIIDLVSSDLILPVGFEVKKTFGYTAHPAAALVENDREGREILFSFTEERISENHYQFRSTAPLKPATHKFTAMVVASKPPGFEEGVFLKKLDEGFFKEENGKHKKMLFFEEWVLAISSVATLGTATVLMYFFVGFILLYFCLGVLLVLFPPKTWSEARVRQEIENGTFSSPGTLGYWLSAFGLVLSILTLGFMIFISPWRPNEYYLLVGGYFLMTVFYIYQKTSNLPFFSGTKKVSKIFLWLGPLVYFLWDLLKGLLSQTPAYGIFYYSIFDMVPYISIAILNLLFFIFLEKRVLA